MAYKESIEFQKPNVHTNGNYKSSASTGQDNDVVLKVDNLSKKFCRNLKRSMYYGIRDLAKGLVGKRPDQGELRQDEFWALNDINFELKENEILGIIGANGSGKSTLLRVLTGIYPPDKGHVWIDGTVGGIIALGAGMHPHMTGRENIYLNGTILGMTKEEIDEKYDDIVEFAEIGDFLEAPFNTYSSGMRVRLGFAVAVHFQPDILLVDEVLAVGDLSFKNKSLRKMAEYQDKAKALIYISHNLEQVKLVSEKTLVLDKGEIVYAGKTDDAIDYYENMQMKKYDSKKYHIVNDGRMNIKDINVIKQYHNDKKYTYDLNINIELYSKIYVENPSVSVGILNDNKENVIWVKSHEDGGDTLKIKKGASSIRLLIKNCSLTSGLYDFAIAIRCLDSYQTYLRSFFKNYLEIESNKLIKSRGMINAEAKWYIS